MVKQRRPYIVMKKAKTILLLSAMVTLLSSCSLVDLINSFPSGGGNTPQKEKTYYGMYDYLEFDLDNVCALFNRRDSDYQERIYALYYDGHTSEAKITYHYKEDNGIWRTTGSTSQYVTSLLPMTRDYFMVIYSGNGSYAYLVNSHTGRGTPLATDRFPLGYAAHYSHDYGFNYKSLEKDGDYYWTDKFGRIYYLNYDNSEERYTVGVIYTDSTVERDGIDQFFVAKYFNFNITPLNFAVDYDANMFITTIRDDNEYHQYRYDTNITKMEEIDGDRLFQYKRRGNDLFTFYINGSHSTCIKNVYSDCVSYSGYLQNLVNVYQSPNVGNIFGATSDYIYFIDDSNYQIKTRDVYDYGIRDVRQYHYSTNNVYMLGKLDASDNYNCITKISNEETFTTYNLPYNITEFGVTSDDCVAFVYQEGVGTFYNGSYNVTPLFKDGTIPSMYFVTIS